MKPVFRAVMKRFLLGLPLDALGCLVTYWLSGRWDMTTIVGACLVTGHLNSLYILYLVRRRKL